jgi:hypothetical protein
MIELTDVIYVKRITVGSTNPDKPMAEVEIQQAMDLLNRCLSTLPKGRIIGLEKSASVTSIGDHQVMTQALVYHVGFARKPHWLDE